MIINVPHIETYYLISRLSVRQARRQDNKIKLKTIGQFSLATLCYRLTAELEIMIIIAIVNVTL